MTWTLVQKSAAQIAGSGVASINVTLPGGSTAHNLLQIQLTSSGVGFSLPAGWVLAADIANQGNSRTQLWDFINCTAGISSVTCTLTSGTGSIKGVAAEFHTDVVSPVVTRNAVGTGIAGTAKTCPVTTGTAAAAGDLAVCGYHQRFTPNPKAITWTTPAGFVLIGDDTASDTHHQFSAYNLSVAAGALTVTGTSNTAADNANGWTGAVVTYTATSAAGVPYLIGSNQSVVSATTTSLTSAVNTAAGDAIVVAATTSGSLTVTGVADSKSNSYSVRKSGTSQFDQYIYVADNSNNPAGTTALTNADTITVTWSAANTNSKVIIAAGVTGYAGTDAAPAQASSAGSTTPSVASGALGQAQEVIFYAFANANGGGAPSAFTGCTNLLSLDGSASVFLSLAYALPASAASVTGSCTIVSAAWAAMAVSLKIIPASGNQGLVGAFISPQVFGTGVTMAQAIVNWQNLVGRPLTVRRGNYFKNTWPTTVTADLSADAAAGRKTCISFFPNIPPFSASNPDQSPQLDTFLNSCKNAGCIMDVALYPEPTTNGVAQTDFITAFQFYAPTVRQYFPLVCNFGSFAVAHRNELAFYPGDAYVDKLALDLYCLGYDNGDRLDAPAVLQNGVLVNGIAGLADGHLPNPIPLGVWEFNSSTDPSKGQTKAQAQAFFNYLQSFFTTRLGAGKQNADLMLFNQNNQFANLNTAITAASDYRIPMWDSLFDALNASPVAVGMFGEMDLVFGGTPSLSGPLAGTMALTFGGTPVLAATGSAVSASTFPLVPLDLRCEMLLGGTWTPAGASSHHVLQRDAGTPVVITRGRPDEMTQASPSAAAFHLNNRDGRYSPRNPTGPFYGQLSRNNTPVRFSVPASGTFARMEDNSLDTSATKIATPSAAGLNITGSIDIRIDMQLSGWTPCVLAAKYASSGNQRSWALVLNADGSPGLWWSTDGTFANTRIVNGLPSGPVPLGRSMLRVTMNANTGTVTFWTAATMGGSQTQLSQILSSGATSIFSSTAELGIGRAAGVNSDNAAYYSPNGVFYEFALRNGIGGSVVADPVFTGQNPGTSRFTDAQSVTWTMYGAAEISARSYRGHFEMSAMPQQWDVTGADVWTPVTAAGVLRRIRKGNPKPVPSAMKRAVTSRTGTLAPVAYWPGEDGAGAGQFASGIAGGFPMTWSGTPSLAADSASFLCSGPLPQPGSSIWRGPAGAQPATGTVVVRFLLNIAAGPAIAVPLRLDTTGSAASMYVYWVAGFPSLILYSSSLGQLTALGVALNPGVPAMVSVELTTSGTTVTAALRVMGLNGVITSATSTFAGTAGQLTGVQVNPYTEVNPPATALGSGTIGHIFAQNGYEPLANFASPLAAWNGEAAGNRFARLCKENQLPARIYGYPSVTTAMGPQTSDTLTNLLQACEDADHGQIYEPRQALALGYRTLASMTGQAAQVTLNYAAAQIGDGSASQLVPTDDDQLTANDITVTRGASGYTATSATVQLADGSPMSISPPPAGVGDYAAAATVNLATEAQIADAAGWLVHLGTVNDERYPLVPLNLGRSELTSQLFTLQEINQGDYVAISNPPAWLPPGNIKLITLGATETLGGYHWHATWNCVPESPYETGIYDDVTYGRADTDGSALRTAIGSGDTTFQADTTGPSGLAWTTAAADFPLTVIMGGETMTVSNITSYDNLVTADSPAAWWKLADPAGSTTAADSSGNGRTGTPAAVTFGQPGFTVPLLTAGKFNGSTSKVDTTYNPAGGTAFSVEIWVNLQGAPAQNAYLIANSSPTADNKGFAILLSSAFNNTTFAVGNGTTNAAPFGSYIGLTGWHQIVGTYDGANARLYIDGAGPAIAALAGSMPAGGANIGIGYLSTNSTLFFKGLLAEAAVYLSVLSAADIAAKWANGPTQVFTVTRSANGVVKTHARGEDIRLATPPVFALT